MPIRAGNDIIGAIGVSGGTSTKQVEACARKALDGHPSGAALILTSRSTARLATCNI